MSMVLTATMLATLVLGAVAMAQTSGLSATSSAAPPTPKLGEGRGQVILTWDEFVKITGYDPAKKGGQILTISWAEVEKLLDLKVERPAVQSATVDLRWTEFKALLEWSVSKKGAETPPPTASKTDEKPQSENKAPVTVTPQLSNESYILTPEPSPKPKINGAKIFGVHPGNPVIFTIPVTGDRPMTFSAKNLPKGLELDKVSGRFSGSIKAPGTYVITINVKNESGSDERDFHIVAGDKLALTPPMGWNSWSGWGDFVTDENVRSTAEAMVKTDLINHGWTNINIDIGWEGKRGGKFNAIQPNKRFPDMKGLCDYVHSLGLKTGIYSTPWVRTYFGYTGGSSDNEGGFSEAIKVGRDVSEGQYFGKYAFVKNDVRQWEEWGIDYIKYDWTSPIDKPDIDQVKAMSETLRGCKRDIIFSLCNLLSIDNATVKLPLVQLWRTTTDIRDIWDRSTLKKDLWAQGISNIWDTHREWREFTKPGCWADPDTLAVGWVGFGDTVLHKTLLTPDEQYTHISLWCLWSAPLFIGSPVEKLDKFTLSLLSNDEVIEIDQDPLGQQAYLAIKDGDAEVWVKRMEDGSKAVGLFNRSAKEITVRANWGSLGIYGKQRVRDVWRQKDLGTFEKTFGANVPFHGVVLVRICPE